MSQNSFPTQQQKRLACDRCHGQKLRCKAEKGDPSTCERCLKAGLPCAWSAPSRPGRPSKKTQQRLQMQSAAPTIHIGAGLTDRSGRGVAEASQYATPSPGDPVSITPTTEDGRGLGHHGNGPAAGINTSTEPHLSYSVPNPTSFTPNPAPNPLFDQPNPPSFFDLGGFDFQGFGYPLSDAFAPSLAQPSYMNFSQNMDFSAPSRLDMSSSSFRGISVQPAAAQGTGSTDSHRDESGCDHVERPIPLLESQEACIDLLSEIAKSCIKSEKLLLKWWQMFGTPTMYIERMRSGEKPCDPDLSPIKYPWGAIFHDSQRLLRIAERFFLPNSSSRRPMFSSTSGRQRSPPARPEEELPSPYSMPQRSRSHSIASASSSTPSEAGDPTDDADGGPFGANPHLRSTADLLPLDLPLALNILSAYVRLLSLYHIILIQTYNFLYSTNIATDKRMFDKKQLIPHILPGLNLNGFVPAGCGTLQILLIVQISCHMIDQMDRYLGVETCIKTPKDVRRKGAGAGAGAGAGSSEGGVAGQVEDGEQVQLEKGLLGVLSPEIINGVLEAEWARVGSTSRGQGGEGGLDSLRRSIKQVKGTIRKLMRL